MAVSRFVRSSAGPSRVAAGGGPSGNRSPGDLDVAHDPDRPGPASVGGRQPDRRHHAHMARSRPPTHGTGLDARADRGPGRAVRGGPPGPAGSSVAVVVVARAMPMPTYA